MLEPQEVYSLILGHHLPALTESDQRVMAARVSGWHPKLIGERTFRSEHAVYDHLGRLLDMVCGPLGVERDPAVLGWWFALHSTCPRRCAARALELIATGAVFPAESSAEIP